MAETGARGIPHPLPSHPGDVFVVSEEVAVESSARLNCASSGAWSQANIRVRGNFGAAGQPVLVVRLVPE